MKALPNILTSLRLVLTVLVFVALIWAAGGLPFAPVPSGGAQGAMLVFALVGFVVAAVTDFFDGWLARRYNAVSLTGAILDPIADKILVCGGLIGLVALGDREAALPAGLILFREFSVSAMREVLAPRGIKLPVTFLAKTKTTLQLVAITAILAVPLLASWMISNGRITNPLTVHRMMDAAHTLLWLAALVTVWTGGEYAMSARRALRAEAPRA